VPPPPSQLGTRREEEESSYEEYGFKEGQRTVEEPVPAIEIDLCDPEVVTKLTRKVHDNRQNFKAFKY